MRLRDTDRTVSAYPATDGIRRRIAAAPKSVLSAATIAVVLSASPTIVAADESEDPRVGTSLSDQSEALRQPAVAATRSLGSPEAVDLSDRFPPAGFQTKSDGASWALAYATMSYYLKGSRDTFSPSFVHDLINRGRACRHAYSILDAAKTIEAVGLVETSRYPYRSDCSEVPTALMEEAKRGRFIRRLDRVTPLRASTVRSQLAKSDPVVVALDLPAALASGNPGTTVVEARAGGRTLGTQAMVVVAYDSRRHALKLLNSWGPSWGDRGGAWISDATFDGYVREGWVVRPDAPPAAKNPSVATETPRDRVSEDGSRRTSSGADTRRGESGSSMPPVRDLVDIGCAATADPVDGAPRARGIRVDGLERVRSEAQCALVEQLSGLLTTTDRPAISLPGGKVVYRKDDSLLIDVRAPSRASFVHVAYLQADGSVVHLQQSSPRALLRLGSSELRRFGTGLAGSPRFTVQAPFGDELILAIASEAPLFDRPRPTVEKMEDFAKALGSVVRRGGFSGSADFVALATVDAGDGEKNAAGSPPATDARPPTQTAVSAPETPKQSGDAAPRRPDEPSVSTDGTAKTPGPPPPNRDDTASPGNGSENVGTEVAKTDRPAFSKDVDHSGDTAPRTEPTIAGEATAGPTSVSSEGSTKDASPKASSDLPIITAPKEDLKPGPAQAALTAEDCARMGGHLPTRSIDGSDRLGKLTALMTGACELVLPTVDQTSADLARRIVRSLVPSPRSATRGIGSGALEAARPSIDLSITFESGSARLKAESLGTLRALGEALSSPELAGMKFSVAGHADAVGNPEANLRLSRQRAAVVVDHLATFWHVPRDRIESSGWGSNRLKDTTNPTAEVNRRVEITNLGDR